MRCHAAKVVDDAITVVAVAGAAAVDDPIRPGTRVPFVPPFGAIHVAWSSPHDVEQWIRRAPSPVFTAARLHEVVDDHRKTRFAVAPYTPASARLRELLGELAADGMPDDVRARTVELLGAIDRLDYTSDDLDRGEPLPVGHDHRAGLRSSRQGGIRRRSAPCRARTRGRAHRGTLLTRSSPQPIA